MRFVAAAIFIGGVLLAQQQEPPPAKPPATAKGPKKAPLARQRAAIKRQIGDPDENGWFFWPWPKPELQTAPSAPPPADPPPAPSNQ